MFRANQLERAGVARIDTMFAEVDLFGLVDRLECVTNFRLFAVDAIISQKEVVEEESEADEESCDDGDDFGAHILMVGYKLGLIKRSRNESIQDKAHPAIFN